MREEKTIYADSIFFPAGALFALLALPLWLAMSTGGIPQPGLYWHAHEMLFGYVLVVLAGYLIGRTPRARVAFLLSMWLAARVAPFIVHGATVALVSDLAFVLIVVALTAWPFLRAAKKLQNRVFAPLLVALLACDVAYQYAAVHGDVQLQFSALLITVDLYTLLVLMMGGRVIPAAVGGHYYRNGRILEARVQPRLEKTAIAAMIGMIVLDLFAPFRGVAGALAIAAAVVTAIRAARWRLWTVLDEAPLWTLGLGYMWLIPGLAVKGYAEMTGSPPLGPALHGLTIGAIGTVTLVMMARTRLQRARRGLAPFTDIAIACVLLSVAGFLRWAAMLWPAGVAWTAAFAILMIRLVRTRRRIRPAEAHRDRLHVSSPDSRDEC